MKCDFVNSFAHTFFDYFESLYNVIIIVQTNKVKLHVDLSNGG